MPDPAGGAGRRAGSRRGPLRRPADPGGEPVTDIVRSDAATLAAKIAARELSSTEITQACLDQIEATDDRYHAFLHVAADEALSAAAAVDKALAAGESL